MAGIEENKKLALAKIIDPMGKEELKVLKFYVGLLDKIDDPDAWYAFRKMISDSAHHLVLDVEMLMHLMPEPREAKETPRSELIDLMRDLDWAEEYEKEALRMYNEALPEVEDPYMKGTVRWIRDEEIRHVKIVRELKTLVEKKMAKAKKG